MVAIHSAVVQDPHLRTSPREVLCPSSVQKVAVVSWRQQGASHPRMTPASPDLLQVADGPHLESSNSHYFPEPTALEARQSLLPSLIARHQTLLTEYSSSSTIPSPLPSPAQTSAAVPLFLPEAPPFLG